MGRGFWRTWIWGRRLTRTCSAGENIVGKTASPTTGGRGGGSGDGGGGSFLFMGPS